MRGTTAPRLLLELVCARVLLPAAANDEAAVLSRVERLERRLDIAGPPAVEAQPRRTLRPGQRSSCTAERTYRADVCGRTPSPPARSAPLPHPRANATRPRRRRPPSRTRPQPGPGRPLPRSARRLRQQRRRHPRRRRPPPHPRSQSAASSGLDAAGLRRGWDAVLDAVKASKRVTHARLLDSQVLGLTGRTLQLASPRQLWPSSSPKACTSTC